MTPTRAGAQRVLAAAALLALCVAVVLATDSMTRRPDRGGGDRFSAPWRADYDRGWAWLVQTQESSQEPDQLAMAGCRWWADGDGRRVGGIEDRPAFVAGCDTAATMTRLEGPR